MPAQLETHRASALYEFEESIRMDCLTLNEAIDLLRSSDSTFFVVGKGIKEYLPLLRSLGAHDLWKVEENDLHTLQKLYKKYPKKYRDNPHLMYAYIDYVLLHSDAHLLIFLPEKNGILEDGFGQGLLTMR